MTMVPGKAQRPDPGPPDDRGIWTLITVHAGCDNPPMVAGPIDDGLPHLVRAAGTTTRELTVTGSAIA
jgi:hypothetical protein